MKLWELLEDEPYLKSAPDEKRVILEKWYDFNIKQDPRYDPASDENMRTVIFRDVPPTHIQESPSLLQELPKPEPYEPPEGAIRAWEPRTIGEKVSSAISAFARVPRSTVSKGFKGDPGALVQTAFEPFQRAFEHPLANVATEIQETGTISPVSLFKAGTAPIRKIKLEPEERKMLSDIFRNYNKALTQVTGVETPKIDEMSAATGGLALRLLMPDVYRATKGVIAKGAKQKLFERTLKTVNTKLKKAGYEDEFIKIFREDLNKALSKSTVQHEINRYIKAQKFRPEVKGPKIAGPKAPIKPTKAIEAFKPIVKAPALPKSGVAQVDKAIASVAKTPGIKLDTLKKTLTGDIIGNMTPIADRKATPAAIKSALTKLENVKAAIKADDIDNLGMYNIYKPAEKPALEAFKPKAPVSLEAEAKKYKTAAEFVESQKLFHGTYKEALPEIRKVGFKAGQDLLDVGKPTNMLETHIAFTTKKSIAKDYAEDAGIDFSLTKTGVIFEIDKNSLNILDYNKKPHLKREKFSDYLLRMKKAGFDAVDTTNATKEAGDVFWRGHLGEVAIVNPKKIKSFDDKVVEQLTRIWQQAHKPEVKAFEPKKAKVEAFKPREEPKKVSGVAKSIQAKAVEKGLIDKGFNELAEYTPAVIKEQADKMATIMRMDIEKAKRIATGREALPEGLKSATALQVMEDYAMQTKDGQLAMDLANSPIASEISTAAQTLRLSAERTPDSATAKIKEIAKTREMVVEKKLKGRKPEKIKSTLKDSLKKKIAKTKPNKYDWNKFVDSITC